ncbi:ribokinase [Drosophila mojavensis]|uniref:Ribokinase n=1 Tax=Drosophila mojavensis TaxID=7230 RepID=B4L7X7_DROMO|nr:ribokinase [Drosophila mojavensis]XP_032588979.1 ribokinase [Drosophila mojavensis]EDW05552.1 uncharacterized protein Dmoj_GI11097 [Drosophila mojavensis]
MEESLDVLVFGSAIIDFVCYAPRLPNPGETLHGTKFQTGFGGKGANQCVAATRLGSKTALIAKLGCDSFGNNYIRHLQAEKINVKHVQLLPDYTTGVAQIAVAHSGENNIIIVVGANNMLGPKDVENASYLFDKAKVLVCQLETPINGTLEALRRFKGISILNAAPAIADAPMELIQLCTILCVNETEAGILVGRHIDSINDAFNALAQLIHMGANIVIITLGKIGAVCSSRATRYDCQLVSAPLVPPELTKDTTGAGDAFIGALAHSYAHFPEKALADHIASANVVASKSVQRLGTQSSFPYA